MKHIVIAHSGKEIKMDRLLLKNRRGGVERICHYGHQDCTCYDCIDRTKCNADIFEKLAVYEELGKTPEELRKIMLRHRVLEFNTAIAKLEKDGYRSGGWDEKLNKTAIVKDGLRPNETKIVGWIDMDGNIEWL